MKMDDFGDRMKFYEGFETNRKTMPQLPIMVRLDGRSFHTWCKGLKRPYDKRLNDMMMELTTILVRESNAKMGYTQSDEITLSLWNEDYKSMPYFNGRLFKITSMLAAVASVHFNRLVVKYIPEKEGVVGYFDCRVWTVPSLEEGANNFLWREMDATKNSISMAAQSEFSHSKLQNKSSSDMQDMLMLQKGINWNDYPDFFKRGSYVRRKTIKSKPTIDELELLSEKHHARQNPNLEVERSVIERMEMPIFSKVTNRKDVIYFGEEPVVDFD